MSNIKDVATLAGVGTSTVSRVLNNTSYVSPENRKKVLAAIKKLNYVPNKLGWNLRAQKSHLVALFVPTIMHTFFSKIAFFIEEELYKQGYGMVIVSSQTKKKKELKLFEIAKSGQVDGIILITDHEYKNYSFAGMNIVTYDRHIEKVPCITSNNYESTYKAIKHLIDKGCRKIAYIGGKNKADSEVNKRYAAYLDIMKEYGLKIIDCYVNLLHGEEYNIACGFLHANQDIDGIFAQSDVFANCCYQIVTQQLNKKVPREVKIIAFDGIMDEILQYPKFTVVKQDIKKISKTLVRELMKSINGEEKKNLIVIPTEFILGETTEEVI